MCIRDSSDTCHWLVRTTGTKTSLNIQSSHDDEFAYQAAQNREICTNLKKIKKIAILRLCLPGNIQSSCARLTTYLWASVLPIGWTPPHHLSRRWRKDIIFMDRTISSFLQHLIVEKGFSRNTSDAYRNDLGQFWEFIQDQSNRDKHTNSNGSGSENANQVWSAVDINVLNEYIEDLRGRKGYRDTTTARKVASIKSVSYTHLTLPTKRIV